MSVLSLSSIAEDVEAAILADGAITDEEEHARRLFADYMADRASSPVSNPELVKEQKISLAVLEYEGNVEAIAQQFQERTRLQDGDVVFLIAATALQVMRVLVINQLTNIEAAGKGNGKEDFLHDFQKNTIGRLEGGDRPNAPLYASRAQVFSTVGVPYDATHPGEMNFDLFKGANHRFATLGHDPLLGLIVGTANIMTNSITCVKSTNPFGVGLRIPITNMVDYDASGKNPTIGLPVATTMMLGAAANRVVDEPDVAAAALLKQLIHIGTDIYTPCGIQIPGANLLLNKASAEKLTHYVSTGDVLKIGASAGLTVFINWLIASLHGCSLIFKDNGDEWSFDLCQARTKKILMISDTIATASSLIQATTLGDPTKIDLGGAAISVYRLFTDVNFITKLKYEFLNSEVSKIYEERSAGLY